MTAALVVFSGPPCSGKTSIAAALAAGRGLPHLQMDTTRQRILPDSPHTRADRATAYRAMHMAAELLLSRGIGVILDAPYGHAEDRRDIARVVRSAAAQLYLVECAVAPETAVARLGIRGPDPVRVDLTAERVGALARDFRYSHLGLLLETDRLDPAEGLRRAEDYLAAGPPVDPEAWV
jgi:predicted kinase